MQPDKFLKSDSIGHQYMFFILTTLYIFVKSMDIKSWIVSYNVGLQRPKTISA